jgi:hypothetical protein
MCEKRDRIVGARAALLQAMRAHLPEECAEILDRIESDDKGHNLSWSLDNPMQVSYAAKPEHIYDSAKRMRTSLGRYLSRNYDVTITPKINAAIDAIFAAIAYDSDCFAVRENVYDVYCQVASSCMTEMDCVRFYENNGVRVVTYTPHGAEEPIARALLWQTDRGEFLDRIYPNSGPHIDHYHKWAQERGCDVREHNSMGDVRVDHRIKIVRIGPMPYLDTFCYLSGDTLSTNGDGLCCRETSGQEPIDCEHCGDLHFDSNESGYCESCENDSYSCERCGDRTFDPTEVCGQTVCESCAEESYCCDRCQESVWETNHVDGLDVCESCESEAVCCDRCCESVWETSHVDGQDVCESCESEAHECEDCEEKYFDQSPLLNQGRDLCKCCCIDSSNLAVA